MKLFDPEDLPEDVVVCGAPTQDRNNDSVEKKCMKCGAATWISSKNADRKHFMCFDCASSHAGGFEVCTTKEDIEQVCKHLGLPEIPIEDAVKIFSEEIDRHISRKDGLQSHLRRLIREKRKESGVK